MRPTTERTQGLDFLKRAHDLRDAGMSAVAKLAIQVTNSRQYRQANATVGAPLIFARAVTRGPMRLAMAHLLTRLQMPSREDVLALSRRLTRIEMVLDDLGATLEMVRAATRPPPERRREAPLTVLAFTAPAIPLAVAKEH